MNLQEKELTLRLFLNSWPFTHQNSILGDAPIGIIGLYYDLWNFSRKLRICCDEIYGHFLTTCLDEFGRFPLFPWHRKFLFSNHVIPLGEFKYFNLRRNLAKLKPALAITEGVFTKLVK